MTLLWLWLLLAFLAGMSVCYWKRAWIMSHWQRPRKEPVDLVAARLDSAVDRLERVHADLERTVSVMQNGAPASEHPLVTAPRQWHP